MNPIFPNDQPVIPQLAFPSGQRVLIGPMDYGGMSGVVDWSLDQPLPAGRHMPAMRMTESYPGTVPVRVQHSIAFTHHRWLQAVAS